jgi:hypothetical protein
MRIDELFEVKNGIASSEVSVMPRKEAGCIPFIRPASTQQRTLAGWVKRDDMELSSIYPAGSLFVSTNGEGSHSYSYVSNFEFVPNSDVSVLIPKNKAMTLQEKIYYARCITLNRLRFSYGRKPKGARLKSVELPDVLPGWVNAFDMSAVLFSKLDYLKNLSSVAQPNAPGKIGVVFVPVSELFEIVYGTNLEMVRMTQCADGINFVSRTFKNNGVTAKVARVAGIEPTGGGVLSVACGGSVLETFAQLEPFYSGRDLFFLRPKEPMCAEELLFYATCIRANKYRYSYGRQANKTLKDIEIPARQSIPSWIYGSLASLLP